MCLLVISLIVGPIGLYMLCSSFLSEKSRGLLSRLLSKIGNFATTLAAIAIGTTSTTHFYSLVLSNQQSPDSILKPIYFALHVLETPDSSVSVWKTAFAASLATSLGWNIVAFERWNLNIIAQLIMGTSFGVNAGIAVGMTDIPRAGCIAFGAAAIVIASLHILDLTAHLFVNWLTEQVINKIRKYIYEYFRNELRRILENMMSQVWSFSALLFEETQVQLHESQRDDDFPTFDVRLVTPKQTKNGKLSKPSNFCHYICAGCCRYVLSSKDHSAFTRSKSI
ncbi:hypothetical protein HOLleu_26847 [Holothuria leucospilota]|uniref:Uncharacterized protein n=1 Tax=Holothuria leucospilota TaxID=206669 RepID=A0A9Q1H337_HOLLE|nr:hypothetical protein HOLleu_26847 [Holothuria leucospilota]